MDAEFDCSIKTTPGLYKAVVKNRPRNIFESMNSAYNEFLTHVDDQRLSGPTPLTLNPPITNPDTELSKVECHDERSAMKEIYLNESRIVRELQTENCLKSPAVDKTPVTVQCVKFKHVLGGRTEAEHALDDNTEKQHTLYNRTETQHALDRRTESVYAVDATTEKQHPLTYQILDESPAPTIHYSSMSPPPVSEWHTRDMFNAFRYESAKHYMDTQFLLNFNARAPRALRSPPPPYKYNHRLLANENINHTRDNYHDNMPFQRYRDKFTHCFPYPYSNHTLPLYANYTQNRDIPAHPRYGMLDPVPQSRHRADVSEPLTNLQNLMTKYDTLHHSNGNYSEHTHTISGNNNTNTGNNASRRIDKSNVENIELYREKYDTVRHSNDNMIEQTDTISGNNNNGSNASSRIDKNDVEKRELFHNNQSNSTIYSNTSFQYADYMCDGQMPQLVRERTLSELHNQLPIFENNHQHISSVMPYNHPIAIAGKCQDNSTVMGVLENNSLSCAPIRMQVSGIHSSTSDKTGQTDTEPSKHQSRDVTRAESNIRNKHIPRQNEIYTSVDEQDQLIMYETNPQNQMNEGDSAQKMPANDDTNVEISDNSDAGEYVYVCHQCGRMYPYQFCLKRHFELKHPDMTFEPQTKKKRAYIYKENKDLITCPKCDRTFKASCGLASHFKHTHPPPTKHNEQGIGTCGNKCPKCKKTFKNPHGLGIHLAKAHIVDRNRQSSFQNGETIIDKTQTVPGNSSHYVDTDKYIAQSKTSDKSKDTNYPTHVQYKHLNAGEDNYSVINEYPDTLRVKAMPSTAVNDATPEFREHVPDQTSVDRLGTFLHNTIKRHLTHTDTSQEIHPQNSTKNSNKITRNNEIIRINGQTSNATALTMLRTDDCVNVADVEDKCANRDYDYVMIHDSDGETEAWGESVEETYPYDEDDNDLAEVIVITYEMEDDVNDDTPSYDNSYGNEDVFYEQNISTGEKLLMQQYYN